MPFHVRDSETDALVRELARKRKVGLTEAIRQAVDAELQRDAGTPSFIDEVRKIQASIASRGDSGVKADKAFFDWLSGEEDD